MLWFILLTLAKAPSADPGIKKYKQSCWFFWDSWKHAELLSNKFGVIKQLVNAPWYFPCKSCRRFRFKIFGGPLCWHMSDISPWFEMNKSPFHKIALMYIWFMIQTVLLPNIFLWKIPSFCSWIIMYRSPIRWALPPWTNSIWELDQDGQPGQVIITEENTKKNKIKSYKNSCWEIA